MSQDLTLRLLRNDTCFKKRLLIGRRADKIERQGKLEKFVLGISFSSDSPWSVK